MDNSLSIIISMCSIWTNIGITCDPYPLPSRYVGSMWRHVELSLNLKMHINPISSPGLLMDCPSYVVQIVPTWFWKGSVGTPQMGTSWNCCRGWPHSPHPLTFLHPLFLDCSSGCPNVTTSSSGGMHYLPLKFTTTCMSPKNWVVGSESLKHVKLWTKSRLKIP